MVPFLKQTADFLAANFGGNLADVCIVLPNRRGGLFLRKYLADALGKVSWAPAVFSIEDFIAEISGLQEVDNMALLFELFEVHCNVEGKNAQTFEEFLRWAPQLLSDFNEVDRCMADAAALFTTLTEARAISLWNLDHKPLTDFETKYLRFYQSLIEYYRQLTERLLARRLAYQGLNFRKAAEVVENVADTLPYSHVVFAGFNALTKSEEKIIGTLREAGRATILWDADKYYLGNRQQEAGDFLRGWMAKWAEKEPRWITDDFAESEKSIRIIGAPDPVGQVKYCGSLLRELALEGKANEKTAVVLLDEGLLIPLLNSIPEQIESLNITAGLPLLQTPLAGFFEAVFNLHLNTARFSYLVNSGSGKFYYRDVLALLRHPYLRRMAEGMTGGNLFACDEVIDRIREGHRIFIGMDDLLTEKSGLFTAGLSFLDRVLQPWKSPADAIKCFTALVENLRSGIVRSSSKSRKPADRPATGYDSRLDLEYLFAFSRVIHQLGNMMAGFRHELKLPAFYQLFQQMISATALPFYGEPLKGVQVMGMLETRTLDFENVIILSCNEDLLPSGKINASFIPFDLKRSFDLPTYRHKDSVYAYHFYRLIQRAKQVWILYNTEPDQLGGGDRSRFLRQISRELPAYNPKIGIREMVLATPPGTRLPAPVIIIPKTGETARLLEEKAARGLSATSLNAYRNCQLKFYYSEIAGIREPEEVEDTIDPAVLGSAVHEALNTLYKPHIDQPLTDGVLKDMVRKSDAAVKKAFEKKFKGSDITYGKNLLFVSVAGLMVKRFLRSEIERVEDLQADGRSGSVAMLEQYLETMLKVSFGEKDLEVRIKGFIDRADRLDGRWKIIDYKTGTTDPKNVKVAEWEELSVNPDLNVGFQLILYGYLLGRRFNGDISSSAGIISLKKVNSGFTAVAVPSEEEGKLSTVLDSGALARFESILLGIIREIYNPELPFAQTSNLNICENCPYINLCCR